MADDTKSSRKYDVPLYCAAWAFVDTAEASLDAAGGPTKERPKKSTVVFGGGGGEGAHGIKNKLIVASYDERANEISAEEAYLSSDDDPPFKIAVHPSGDGLVIAYSKSCKAYDLKRSADGKLSFSERALKALNGANELKFLTFSPDGSKLAAGGEDKRLQVFEWPAMEVLLDKADAHDSPLKDADFSLDGGLLATTADAGPCHVWDLPKGLAVARLASSPAGAAGKAAKSSAAGRLGLCRFHRNPENPTLLTTLIRGGKGLIVVWDTATWQLKREFRIHDEPISCLAISNNGSILATGTGGGDIAIIDARYMTVRQRTRGAHMVFVTAVEFSPDSRALLSVSGDSSARVTAVQPAKSFDDIMNEWALFFFFCFFLGGVVLIVFFIFTMYTMGKYAPD